MTKNKNDNQFTLDAKHNEIINKFKVEHSQIPIKKEKLKRLEHKYTELLSQEDINYTLLYELEKEINEIKEFLDKTEENNKEQNYYLKTNNILFDYYNFNHKLQNENKQPEADKHNENIKHIKIKTLDTYFNKNNKTEINTPPTEIEIDKKGKTIKKTKISHFFSVNSTFNKTDILNEYLRIVDPSSVNYSKTENNNCPDCHEPLEININEGNIECIYCGYSIDYFHYNDKPSYKDNTPDINVFSYKPLNHWNEWMSQFQAKESTNIPDEVFDLIYQEIKKNRIENMADLTTKKLKEFLKKLKLNKYYEHKAYIINRLNGRTPPSIPRDVEEKMRTMFKDIQIPFKKYCPPERKNFLSYSYVFYKFFELLGYHELKKQFTLLKSKQKLQEQDKIWKGICQDLNWKFYPSI